MAATVSSRKRKVLTLAERVKVIERSSRGESAVSIAKSINVGKTQIQSILIDKDSILARWESGESGDRKLSKIRKTTYTTSKCGSGFVKPEEKTFLCREN